MNRWKWYRKFKGGTWYLHQNTYQLPGLTFTTFWARYAEINRYTKIINVEKY